MKKFVIVMITILVLFVFLMLNYLLWDKENLLKQSETDKIEQDWLRGQNRTLQTTVNELEQTIKNLEKDKNDWMTKAGGLERELSRVNSTVEGYKKEITRKDQVIDNYKMFTEDLLCELTLDWFSHINNRDYDAAWDLMAPNFRMFNNQYNREEFQQYLEAIHSITLAEKEGKAGQETGRDTPAGLSFEIRRNYGGEYEVMAVIQAEVGLDEEHAGDVKDWVQGTNRLQVTFLFRPNDQEWAIMSIAKASN